MEKIIHQTALVELPFAKRQEISVSFITVIQAAEAESCLGFVDEKRSSRTFEASAIKRTFVHPPHSVDDVGTDLRDNRLPSSGIQHVIDTASTGRSAR